MPIIITGKLVDEEFEFSEEGEIDGDKVEMYQALEAWVQEKLELHQGRILYVAIHQGKYVLVYYITYTCEQGAQAEADQEKLRQLIESRSGLFYVLVGIKTDSDFWDMINNDVLRHAMDISWYRGTDTTECDTVSDIGALIPEDMSDDW